MPILAEPLQDIIILCKHVEKDVYNILTKNYIDDIKDLNDSDEENKKQIINNPPNTNNIFGIYINLFAYHESMVEIYDVIDEYIFLFNINKIILYGQKIIELLEEVLKLKIDPMYTNCFKGLDITNMSLNRLISDFKFHMKLNTKMFSTYISTQNFELFNDDNISQIKVISYCRMFNIFINDYDDRHPVRE